MTHDILSGKTQSDIAHCARLKQYPGGVWELMASDAPVFREAGWEDRRTDGESYKSDISKQRKPDGERSAEDIDRSLRRAASKVRDLAMCNDFTYFVTLTLDPARVDRYDMAAVVRTLNRWLDNRVRRAGLRYILVPERHKDGAIHLHGFCNDALRVVDSGAVRRTGIKQPRRPRSAAEMQRWLDDGGDVVYNISDWTLGYSTALRLRGDYAAAVGYICKYVRKQAEKIGGRWYFSGGKLEKPVITYADIPYEQVAAIDNAYTFCVPGRAFAIARGSAEGGGNGAID